MWFLSWSMFLCWLEFVGASTVSISQLFLGVPKFVLSGFGCLGGRVQAALCWVPTLDLGHQIAFTLQFLSHAQTSIRHEQRERIPILKLHGYDLWLFMIRCVWCLCHAFAIASILIGQLQQRDMQPMAPSPQKQSPQQRRHELDMVLERREVWNIWKYRMK